MDGSRLAADRRTPSLAPGAAGRSLRGPLAVAIVSALGSACPAPLGGQQGAGRAAGRVEAEAAAGADEAGAPPASAPGSPCGRRAGLAVEVSGEAMTCADGHRDCSAEVVVSVRNCTAGPVTVLRAEWEAFVEAAGRWAPRLVRTFESEPVPSGAVFTDRWTERTAGRIRITVEARAGSRPISASPVELEITNPALEAARRACEACQGIWGTAGLLGLEGCSCRTADAGRPCHDSDECEGLCMFTHHERRTDAAGRSWARPSGECSDRTRIFGCHAIIGSGAAALPEQEAPPGRALRAPYLCID